MTETQRRIVAEAWAFRTRVEREAADRFARLATAISRFDAASPVPALMRGAAEDEQRHAALCVELAAFYGTPATGVAKDVPIAPRRLEGRAAVLYEVVAACCITETESVATLTTLLAEELEPAVEKALRAIARDEVAHGRMGWAHLAREAAHHDVSFLSSWIPAMLSGTVEETLFLEAPQKIGISCGTVFCRNQGRRRSSRARWRKWSCRGWRRSESTAVRRAPGSPRASH